MYDYQFFTQPRERMYLCVCVCMCECRCLLSVEESLEQKFQQPHSTWVLGRPGLLSAVWALLTSLLYLHGICSGYVHTLFPSLCPEQHTLAAIGMPAMSECKLYVAAADRRQEDKIGLCREDLSPCAAGPAWVQEASSWGH